MMRTGHGKAAAQLELLGASEELFVVVLAAEVQDRAGEEHKLGADERRERCVKEAHDFAHLASAIPVQQHQQQKKGKKDM